MSPGGGKRLQPALVQLVVGHIAAGEDNSEISRGTGHLLYIPIPMLLQSRLNKYEKTAAMLMLSADLLVIVCAVLHSVYLVVVRHHLLSAGSVSINTG